MQAERLLTARCQTWSRDSHGLFDYECRSLSEQTIVCSHSGSFTRLGDELQFAQKSAQEQAMVTLQNGNP
jgi:hypothetical protein